MKQADLGLNLSTKRTRKREFLDEMQARGAVGGARADRAARPEGKTGRPPFPVETMLRIHFMQQWFTLSDPAMEEALHDVPLYREFAGLKVRCAAARREHDPAVSPSAGEHKLAAPMILATVNDSCAQGPDAQAPARWWMPR
jgi:IS5 family transposase